MNVYLDNAASTPVHKEVLDTMLPYLSTNYGNPSAIHSNGKKNKAAIELSRKTIAKYLNCKSQEIIFCSSGTEANNIALKLAVENLGVKHIITSEIEHKSVLNIILYLEEEKNVKVSYVNLNKDGTIDIDSLESILKSNSDKALVSIMHAQNELGSINDINKISSLTKKYGALFHTDTVQTIAHIPFNLQENNIDFLTASAHKFHGPLGSGFLYKNEKLKIGTWLHGGGHERNIRSSTENISGIVGMAQALKMAYDNLENEKYKILELKNYFKQELKKNMPNVIFNEAPQNLYTILSVTFPSIKYDLASVLIKLDMKGIAVAGGSACSSGSIKFSNVLRKLKYNENEITLRVSFSIYNTKEELDYTVNALNEL